MSGTVKCLQITVSILCLLLLALGITILVRAVMDYQEVPENRMNVVGIALGASIIAVSIFGLFGAIFKNSCMLIIYCIFLSIAFILAVITVIIGFVASAFIVSTVDAVFRNHLLFYHKMGSSKSFIDHVQKENKCCGYNNHEDWWISEVPEFTVNNGLLPSTCCEPHAENMCQYHGVQSRKVFTQGCKHFVETTTNLYLIAIMASITAIALLVSLILASILTSKIRNEYGMA